MSKCKICSLKQDEHDKELWKFHQLNEVCTWCGKKSWKHSLGTIIANNCKPISPLKA